MSKPNGDCACSQGTGEKRKRQSELARSSGTANSSNRARSYSGDEFGSAEPGRRTGVPPSGENCFTRSHICQQSHGLPINCTSTAATVTKPHQVQRPQLDSHKDTLAL
jgi:hypothetical protein